MTGETKCERFRRLGVFPDGSCCKLEVVPLPARGLSKKEIVIPKFELKTYNSLVIYIVCIRTYNYDT